MSAAAFEFASANRIIFKPDAVELIPQLAADRGQKVFLLTGGNPQRASRLQGLLEGVKLDPVVHSISGAEPTVDMVEQAVAAARAEKTDVVIAYGGGSVIDVGKVVAAMLTNDGELFDYLEVIGKAQPLKAPSAPYIAVPTTAGTGSEVTRNAVIDSPEHQVKVSMRSPYMLPDVAVIDPALTCSMPPALTASTGLDALTQVIEPFVCNKSNPITDAICREAISIAGRSLRQAYDNGTDLEARTGMATVSLIGGLALANSGLGAVHGFAGPLGGMIHAPHGELCARLLPIVIKANISALKEREPGSEYLSRYKEVACLLTGDRESTTEDLIKWLEDICQHMAIRGLAECGLSTERISEAVTKSAKASSMKANPVELTESELRQILIEAM